METRRYLPGEEAEIWKLLALILFLFSQNGLSNCDEVVRAMIEQGHVRRDGFGDTDKWAIDGPERVRQEPYEESMDAVLGEVGVREPSGHFDRWVAYRRRDSKSAHVLDLFGSGFFLQHPQIASSITGIRWGAYDRTKLADGYTAPAEVLGDILNPETWRTLDSVNHQRNISKVDLVTMRPEGGWAAVMANGQHETFNGDAGNALAISFIIRNVEQRLSADGEFFFAIPLFYGKFIGQLDRSPILLKLQKQIAENSNRLLILRAEGGDLQGALVPRSKVTSFTNN